MTLNIEEVLRERYREDIRDGRDLAHANVHDAFDEGYEAGSAHESQCVRAFHEAAGQPVREVPTVPSDEEVRLRARLILEEVEEAFESMFLVEEGASLSYGFSLIRQYIDKHSVRVDLVNLARELTDIQYVTTGTQVQMGLPKEACFDEVQRANFEKVKNGVRLDGGKVQKPEGWQPPDIARVLREHGMGGGE